MFLKFKNSLDRLNLRLHTAEGKSTEPEKRPEIKFKPGIIDKKERITLELILNVTFYSQNYLDMDLMINLMVTLGITYEAVASESPDLILPNLCE